MSEKKGRPSASDAKTVLPARDNSGGKEKPGGAVVARRKYNQMGGEVTEVVVISGRDGWTIREEKNPLDENAA
jgi:hypothetical protein